MRVNNTGAVFLTQRFLAATSVELDMQDYPVDAQTLTWSLRSTVHNSSVVRFLPSSGQVNLAESQQLQGVSDTSWTLDRYSQSDYNVTLTNSIFANFDILTVSIHTTPPYIKRVYTTEKDGNYSVGKNIDVIVEFSRNVKFSQQPDIFSQVPWLRHQ